MPVRSTITSRTSRRTPSGPAGPLESTAPTRLGVRRHGRPDRRHRSDEKSYHCPPRRAAHSMQHRRHHSFAIVRRRGGVFIVPIVERAPAWRRRRPCRCSRGRRGARPRRARRACPGRGPPQPGSRPKRPRSRGCASPCLASACAAIDRDCFCDLPQRSRLGTAYVRVLIDATLGDECPPAARRVPLRRPLRVRDEVAPAATGSCSGAMSARRRDRLGQGRDDSDRGSSVQRASAPLDRWWLDPRRDVLARREATNRPARCADPGTAGGESTLAAGATPPRPGPAPGGERVGTIPPGLRAPSRGAIPAAGPPTRQNPAAPSGVDRRGSPPRPTLRRPERVACCDRGRGPVASRWPRLGGRRGVSRRRRQGLDGSDRAPITSRAAVRGPFDGVSGHTRSWSRTMGTVVVWAAFVFFGKRRRDGEPPRRTRSWRRTPRQLRAHIRRPPRPARRQRAADPLRRPDRGGCHAALPIASEAKADRRNRDDVASLSFDDGAVEPYDGLERRRNPLSTGQPDGRPRRGPGQRDRHRRRGR